ncbi:MAG: hypothetical protein AVDCRST_MAG03-2432, partial [uncultured Rubrobacteraceae bacterium]
GRYRETGQECRQGGFRRQKEEVRWVPREEGGEVRQETAEV